MIEFIEVYGGMIFVGAWLICIFIMLKRMER